MESKDLIIIICAIIAGACIIAFAIAFVDDFHDDEDKVNLPDRGQVLLNKSVANNTTANNTNDNSQPKPSSDSGVYVVSEVVKYNYQADDGSYYREVTYSDGGFRQYNTSNGKLIGSSYASDQKYLPSME